MRLAYVDTSALAKLLVEEPESAALRQALLPVTMVSSVLAGVELAAVARRRAVPGGIELAGSILRRTRSLPLSDAILRTASLGDDLPALRALDLLHLVTARHARHATGLTTFVAYDQELVHAARIDAFAVSSPE